MIVKSVLKLIKSYKKRLKFINIIKYIENIKSIKIKFHSKLSSIDIIGNKLK